MKSGIYQIICLMNGKSYIGSAIDLNKRWIFHQSQLNRNIHGNKYLQRSWNKYGKEYFDFDIIKYCEIISLVEREQYYIDYMKPQFNICKIAGSPLGCKHTEETKKKMGLAQIGRIHSEESKRKMSLAKIGKTHSEESKRKMSLAQIGNIYIKRKFPDEYIKDIRASKLTVLQLAKEYNCSRGIIYQIKNNKTYKDVK